MGLGGGVSMVTCSGPQTSNYSSGEPVLTVGLAPSAFNRPCCPRSYPLAGVDGLFLIRGFCQLAGKEDGGCRLGPGSVLGKALCPWALEMGPSQ